MSKSLQTPLCTASVVVFRIGIMYCFKEIACWQVMKVVSLQNIIETMYINENQTSNGLEYIISQRKQMLAPQLNTCTVMNNFTPYSYIQSSSFLKSV